MRWVRGGGGSTGAQVKVEGRKHRAEARRSRGDTMVRTAAARPAQISRYCNSLNTQPLTAPHSLSQLLHTSLTSHYDLLLSEASQNLSSRKQTLKYPQTGFTWKSHTWSSLFPPATAIATSASDKRVEVSKADGERSIRAKLVTG
ncbi:hypothetical protein E2C01_071065 [Portunus trituberculatus]|uniref:Uncharacterized protein n=1 Tax=Portunus trituberculatus TaxID=210409 RepID=A0A5B7I3V2_PORTR|nr:hypothetical protein [Portunus trituberculatus]